jgi:hypothetical protein
MHLPAEDDALLKVGVVLNADVDVILYLGTVLLRVLDQKAIETCNQAWQCAGMCVLSRQESCLE